MADRVASGEIYIEVNDREAIASLHRIDAEFDKEMAKIDRQHADVKLGADLDRLKRDLREAVARTKAAEEKMNAAENKRSKAQLKRTAERRKAEEDAARKSFLDAKNRADAQKQVNKELDATEKRLVAIAKRDEKIARASDKAAKQEAARSRDRLKDIDREAKRRKGINDQRVREQKDDERAANSLRREQAMVPKLERSYMRLQDRLEKLAQSKRRAGKDVRARYIVEIEEHDTIKELARIKERIRRAVGRDPIGLPAKPVMGRDAGRNLRLDFERNNRQLGPAAAAAGIRIGRTMGQKVTQGFRNITDRGGIIANTRALGRAIGGAAGRGTTSGLSRIGHAFDGLANMTVRLGPFTSTIRQLLVVMSLLGPSIVDVVGALGSLVSVVGSGALGLANLGTAVIGGGIPAFIGMVTVLKPVVGEMKNATKASQNYQKAVREYGKSSPEAAKKLGIFNNVMKNQTAATRENFLAAGKLKDAWAKATAPSRAKTFDLMGKGLKYLTDNVGFFGKRTNDTFTAVHGSMNRWLNGLKSAEGHQILGTMMDNFNKALGPALDGMGNLVAVFARFGASASRYLPDIMAKFQAWTHGLLDGSKNADVVNGKVDRMMTSLKSVGRFLMATGRLLVAFFRGGVGAGTKFTDTMTKAMTRWTDFLNTDAGQNKLHDFFDRAVSGAQSLFAALAPVLSTFVKWSTAISPFATAFFKGAAAVASLVAKLLSMTALTGPITALAATLGTLWAIGKIQTATMAVANFGRALLGVQALGARGSAMSFLGGTFTRDAKAARDAEALVQARTFTRPPRTQSFAAPIPAGAARETEKVAASAARGAGAFSKLRGAAGGAVMALTGLSPVAAAGVVAVGALAYGIYKLATREDDWANNERNATAMHDRFVSAVKATPATMAAAAQSHLQYGQAVRAVTVGEHEAAAAQQRVDALRRQGKQGTEQYKQAVDEARQAQDGYKQSLIDEYSQRTQLEAITARMTRTRDAALGAARGEQTQRQQTVRDMEKESETVKGLTEDYKAAGSKGTLRDFFNRNKGQFSEGAQKQVKAYLDAIDRLKEAQQQAAHAQDLWTLSGINSTRAMAGMVPIADSAAGAVANLVQKIGRTQTAKIALKFPDAKQAAQAMQGVNRAVKSGVSGKAAVNVVTNAPNIAAALRGLNQIRLTTKNLRIFEQGGKEAIRRLEMIAGRKLTRKELKIAQQGGPQVLALLEKLNGKAIPKKWQYIAQSGADTVFNTLNRLIGKNIPNKRFTISAADQASSIVNSVARSLASLHSKSLSVVTHYSSTGNRNGIKGGFSGGVLEARAAGASLIDRALAVAQARPAKDTRGGKYKKPTLLVGEEKRTEYVIATNPAYREKNRGYLARAANDLGMTVVDGAAKGAEPKAKTTPNARAAKRHPKKWKVPPKYKFGGVPLDTIQSQYDAAVSALQDMQQKADSKHSDAQSASKKRKPGLLRDEKKLRKKIPALKVKADRLKKELDAVKAVNRRIDMLNLQIEGERTAMETAAKGSKLAGPNDPHYKEGEPLAPDGISFNDHRNKRTGYMDSLRGILKHALKYAGGQYAQTLRNEIGTIDSDRVDVDRDAGFVRETTDRTVEDLLRDYGKTDDVAREQAAIAIDRTQNLGDPSTWTGAALTDYQADAGALRDTYKAALDRAVDDRVDPNLISGLADLYTQARDAALPPGSPGTDSTASTSEPQGVNYSGAVADSLKADVYRDFGSNMAGAFSHMPLSDPSVAGASWTQQNPAALNPAVAAATSPSRTTAQPSGGDGAGATRVLNQTNNFQQPPADPHTWAQGTAFELGAAI